MFLSQLLLIYLLRVSQSSKDFETKKKLLDAWQEDGDADIDSDTRGEIVYDFFKNDNNEKDAKKSNKIDDDIIILPFFSDEVFTLSEIPEEKNWNFIEINSTKDLLAMENPKQRKYKTQIFKMRPKHQKANKQVSKKQLKNNWNLFKHKFPNFNTKANLNTKKEKRHIPSASQLHPESVLGDPWARVDIKTENNPRINFGSYDEFGRKMQPLSAVQDRLMRDVEDDVSWNITINLDQLNSESGKNNINEMKASVTEKNDRMNVFSEKLERLYSKLEALKNIKAARKQYTPRPPVGNVPKLDRPIAVIVRQDSHNSFRPALLETSVSLNDVPRPVQALNPTKQKSRTMLSSLRDKLGFLIPSKIQRMLQKKTVPAPVTPGPSLGRAAVPSPPWYHYGLPPEIQHRISTNTRHHPPPQSAKTARSSKSLLDILLPSFGF